MAWIEQANRRTRNAKHFQDDVTGQLRAVLGLHDLHYHDGVSWQEVDESIVDDSSIPGYVAKCDKTRHIVNFGNGGERRWYPRRNVPGEYVESGKPDYWDNNRWRVWNLTGLSRGISTVTWDTADYTVILRNTWHQLKLTYILKTVDAAPRVRFPLSLVGLTWNNGDIVGGDNEVVGRIEPPTALDANEVSLPCTGVFSGGYYEINCDVSAALYPVKIDPTFTDGEGGNVTTAYDTWVSQLDPNVNYGTGEFMNLRDRGVYAEAIMTSLERWNLSSISAGATCNSATMSHWIFTSQAGQTGYAHVLTEANNAWTEAGANYGTRDGSNAWAGGANGCSISGTDYNAAVLGSFSLSLGNDVETESTLSNSIVEDYFGGNLNIMMTNSDEFAHARLHTSDTATTGYRPILVIDYSLAGGSLAPVSPTRKLLHQLVR